MKKFVSYFAVFVLGFIICAWSIQHFYGSPTSFRAEKGGPVEQGAPKDLFTGNPVTTAAAKVSAFVVNIDTLGRPVRESDPFSFFFNEPLRERQQQGEGSGVIFTPDGYILTNNHVVQGAAKLTVTLNNHNNDRRQFQAKLIGRDPVTDLAVIKIDANGLPFAQFADSNTAQVGDWVIAVGSPLGFKWTVTLGIISALGRQLDGRERLIQTDAAINMGNSGGALADLTGKVIGINRAIVSPSGGSVGIGFAIPSNTARYVADSLKNEGKVVHPWVGVSYIPLNAVRKDLEQGGLSDLPKNGVWVRQVIENSPAARAGLKAQDVIMKFGGKTISANVEPGPGEQALADLVAETKVGQEVTLEVWHSKTGQTSTVRVRIGETPPNYNEQQP